MKKFLRKSLIYLILSVVAIPVSIYTGLLTATKVQAAGPAVVISEFVSHPSSGSEWVELLNTTGSAVSLVGLNLTELSNPSTTPTENLMLALTGTIPAQGLKTFDVSGLNDTGDSVGLYNGVISNPANLISRVNYGDAAAPYNTNVVGAPAQGKSVGLISGSYQTNLTPTRGWFNETPTMAQIVAGLPAGITTNMGTIADPTVATGLYFAKAGAGKITFSSTVNLTDQATVSTLQSLDTDINFSNGVITFLPSTGDALKTLGATLEMDGLTFPNGTVPVIKVDGVITNSNDVDPATVVYNNGTLTFDAKHFSIYSVDGVAPVVTLNGQNPMNVAQGSTFTDPLATANDAVDGPIATINVTGGPVNTAVIGSTTLTYSAIDSSGNTGTATRMVNVVPKVFIDLNTNGTLDAGEQTFTTIQAAITAASTGNTIVVSAGTYAENITIPKSVLLIGPNANVDPNTGTRVPEAVISGGIGFTIEPEATNITINGFTVSAADTGEAIYNVGAGAADVSGLNISYNIVGTGVRAISLESNGDNVSILHNKLGGYSKDIAGGDGTWNNLKINDNYLLQPTDQSYAVQIGPDGTGPINGFEFKDNHVYGSNNIGSNITNGTVSGNTFDENVANSIEMQIVLHNSTVAGNTFLGHSTSACFQLFGSQYGLVPSDTVTISSNTFTDCGGPITSAPYVFAIQLSQDIQHITITGNTITNAYDGINTRLGTGWDFTGKDIHFNNNSVTSSRHLAANNIVTGTLDAIDNWWGSSDLATVTAGISSNVTFKPYYVDAAKTTLSDIKAITAFNFNSLSPAVVGTVNEAAKTIVLTVPAGTNVTNLVPTITTTGASVSPANGVAYNFTTPQKYTVTSVDGATTQDYTVTVTVTPAPVISSEAASSPTSTSITITWTTANELSTSRVIYDTVSHPSIAGYAAGLNYGYASSTATFDMVNKTKNHSLTITGLTAGTTYYYRTVSSGSPETVGTEASFTTAAAVATPTSAVTPLVSSAQAATPAAVTPTTAPAAASSGDKNGVVKAAEAATPAATETTNWTPWIVLLILVLLAGAVTGGYFYWFAGKEELAAVGSGRNSKQADKDLKKINNLAKSSDKAATVTVKDKANKNGKKPNRW